MTRATKKLNPCETTLPPVVIIALFIGGWSDDMANEFSGDAGFEWNPKQESIDLQMLSEIPDSVKSVWRLRYISNNRVFNTYHPNAKDASMQVRLCVKRGFKVESLHRIKVEPMPVTLGEMIADAEVDDPYKECDTLADACEVTKRLEGL
jgi:hypothetical protein